MAQRYGSLIFTDPGDSVPIKCSHCGEYYTSKELVDTGEAIEWWTWCEKCNSELFHEITNDTNSKTDSY